MPVNEVIKRKVGSDITTIGHGPGHVTKVRLKGMQSGPIALADKAREGLPALMGVQMPGLSLVLRQIDEWCEQLIQSPYDGRDNGQVDAGGRTHQARTGHYQKQFGSLALRPQTRTQLFHDLNGSLNRRWSNPTVGLATGLARRLVDRAAEIGEALAAIP